MGFSYLRQNGIPSNCVQNGRRVSYSKNSFSGGVNMGGAFISGQTRLRRLARELAVLVALWAGIPSYSVRTKMP